MELGHLPVPARPERAGCMAGSGESDFRVVSGLAACACDGYIQCRIVARLRACAIYCRDHHAALRMAVCVRFHGTGWHRVARAVADSLPAAALESLVARGRIC